MKPVDPFAWALLSMVAVIAMRTSNNSSRVLHQQRKPWHWAAPGGAVTTGQQAGQLGTTAAHSSKLWWSRNSCLGRGTCPTGQESPSTQAELGAVAISRQSLQVPHFANISINGSFLMLELNHLHLQNVSLVYIKLWCHAILWPKAALFPLCLSPSHMCR